MNWLGKVIGGAFGLLTGGPLGALLGAALGHSLDREKEAGVQFGAGAGQLQWAFYTATFAVMGHIAKSDGRVSQAEIASARAIMERMDLPATLRLTAMRAFSDGKRADFSLAEVVEKFRSECQKRYSLMQLFMEIQIEAALADGAMQASKERLLLRICELLKFSRFEFYAIKTVLENRLKISGAGGHGRARADRQEFGLDGAYATLGVDPLSSDTEIKRAYRRLLSQHHPDKLAANGLPEDRVRNANETTQKIRTAYDQIRRARKL